MAKDLLPIRILFHSAFALVYLPTIALTFTIFTYLGLTSLLALACLGGFAALDILTIRRKVNQTAFLCIDILLAGSLPMCLFFFIGESIEDVVSPDPDASGTFLPIDLAATVIIIGLPVFYGLYIIIAAVTDKIRGNPFLPVDPDYSPQPSSSGTQRKVLFIGRRRTLTERAAISNHCTSYIFRKSFFRKHAFEPTAWAIFRGIIAVYCFVGLLVFAAYTGYSGREIYANGGAAIQETILPKAQEASFKNLNDGLNYLSVAILNPISQSIPSDISVSSNWNGPGVPTDTFGPSDTGNSQYWTGPLGYPWFDDNGFNVSWSGDVPLYIWATVADVDGPTYSSQAIYSPGFLLEPFKEYDIALTVISYTMNGFSWILLEPYVRSAVASGSNKTMASFSYSSWIQTQIPHRDLIPPSAPALFAQVISAIGGLYASIDAVFALIFGRTMLAILFGSKSISPFGLLGIVTRGRFRRLINEQYPRLQEDIEHGGMAAYVSEVAIDPGLVPNSTSAHLRARVATSSQAQGSHAGDDAEEGGLIPLRSMEPRNTSGKSSHSHLQLPYAIEDYEPARKDDYE